MGKKLIIPGADFSENGINVALTIVVKAGESVTIEGQTYIADANKDTTFEISSISQSFYLNYNNSIKYLRVGTPITLPSMTGAFRNLENAEEVIFAADVNTSAETAHTILANCKKLKKFDASHLYYNAENASLIFYSCGAMKEIKNLIHFNPNITNLVRSFADCYELEVADLSGLQTSHVTDFTELFRACSKLHTIYFGPGLSFAAAETLGDPFNGCSSLRSIYAPSLVASDYNVEGTDTYKLITGAVFSYTTDLIIYCGTGTLHWNGSTWTAS